MSKWTPEPWTACNDGECKCGMINGGEDHIATVVSGDWGDQVPVIKVAGQSGPGSCTGELTLKAEMEMVLVYGHVDPEVAKANCRRIVACVNALAGIDDPAALRRQRDDLLMACKVVAELSRNRMAALRHYQQHASAKPFHDDGFSEWSARKIALKTELQRAERDLFGYCYSLAAGHSPAIADAEPSAPSAAPGSPVLGLPTQPRG